MTGIYDVIVIGSGPAGYTAALYTSRAFLKTKLLSGLQPGGQLTTTTDVDNYPGFSKGIMGPSLMAEMKGQVERFGTEIGTETVTSVAQSGGGNSFVLKTESGELQTKTVIVATGASAMYLGLPSETKLAGKGVSACATCDGFFFRGKEVVVIGGGDTAMEEATFLTKFATKVTVVHRRDEFRASAIMVDRAKKDPKIHFVTSVVVEEIVGDTAVTAIRLKDIKTNKVTDYPTQGVFLAIGHKPNTAFLKDFIELDEKGYVVTFARLADDALRGTRDVDPKKKKMIQSGVPIFSTHTSVRGVFAAGDCVDFRYRQAIVAAGQGCMAAMDAEKYLEGE